MGLKNKRWKSWGATSIGPSHIKSGTPNQDAWITRQYSWGEVAVVSDGVGSKKNSHIGSSVACLAVVKAAELCKGYADNIEYFLRLVHSIWLVSILPYSPKECSATCLFVISARGKALVAQLGDGMIAVSSKEGRTNIFNLDKQDSFSNITSSLGTNFMVEQWRTGVVNLEECYSFVLCTDGIADDITPENQSEFARELSYSYANYNKSQRKKEIEAWLKNWPVPNHSDDKTIVCLYRGKLINNEQYK